MRFINRKAAGEIETKYNHSMTTGFRRMHSIFNNASYKCKQFSFYKLEGHNMVRGNIEKSNYYQSRPQSTIGGFGGGEARFTSYNNSNMNDSYAHY